MRAINTLERNKPKVRSKESLEQSYEWFTLDRELRKAGPKALFGRAYEGFLELPVPVVLTVLWLAGLALMALCALAPYLVWQAL